MISRISYSRENSTALSFSLSATPLRGKVIDGFIRKTKTKAEKGDTASGIIGQLNLGEFADVLDNAPPGTDELVALSKVPAWGWRLDGISNSHPQCSTKGI